MTTEAAGNTAAATLPNTSAFERFAGGCAILAGASGFSYAVSFVILQNTLLSGLFLMLGGLLGTAVLAAVYERLKETDASFALLALVFGVAGAFGAAAHGGYDLANAVNPPVSIPDLPNPVDPRGLLTFGASIALFLVGWLIVRGGRFPKGLGYLAFLSAILVPALLNGFLVNPVLYTWLGVSFFRKPGGKGVST
ncbi:MAG: hypothetical protein ACRDSJ_00320 [Rubrobacteraceae bacterium]